MKFIPVAALLCITEIRATGRRKRYREKPTEATVRAFLDAIAWELRQGRKVSFPGFGVFRPASRKARQIRNPATGELMRLPLLRTVGFRPSLALKVKVASKPKVTR